MDINENRMIRLETIEFIKMELDRLQQCREYSIPEKLVDFNKQYNLLVFRYQKEVTGLFNVVGNENDMTESTNDELDKKEDEWEDGYGDYDE